jgi:hypothetical protein
MNLLTRPRVEEGETGRPGLGKEADMGTSIATVGARCPLCGSPVLSVARSGKVIAFELRTIPLANDISRGYTLCDDCGVLADLPAGLTLN